MAFSRTLVQEAASLRGLVLASDVDVQQASLCVVINQPVGNPKRKV
jgi:hypothetical protein